MYGLVIIGAIVFFLGLIGIAAFTGEQETDNESFFQPWYTRNDGFYLVDTSTGEESAICFRTLVQARDYAYSQRENSRFRSFRVDRWRNGNCTKAVYHTRSSDLSPIVEPWLHP